MRRRQGFLFFYLCAAISALTLLAAGLPQLSFRPGRSFILNGDQVPDTSSSAPAASMGDLGYWRMLLTAIVLVLLGYFVLTLIFSAKLRWQLLRQLARVLLVVLLFYLILSRLIGTPELLPPSQPAANTPPAQIPTGEPLPAFVAQPEPWLVALVSLVLAALLIAGIWYFWRRSRPVANPVTTLAQAAIESIQSGGDVQSVVLRCYLEMSQVLGQQRGIERARAMTPREFAQHLAASGVRDEHIQQLTRLFEGARYGAQPPSARDERAAVECLRAIVQAYGGAA
jgi:uncharacterized protein DUF4129